MSDVIDLREGFRVEVEALIMPAGEFGARLFRPPATPRGRWKQVGHMVVAGTPEKAASDLLKALDEDLLPDVLVQA